MKIIVLAMCLFFQFCLGQAAERVPLHGQVLYDSVNVEGGYVFNLTLKIKTLIGLNGYFDILAKKNDTLLVSSLAFQSRKLILTPADLQNSLYIVKLETFTNTLKEVTITKTRIPYLGSKQEIIDTPYFDDSQSTAKNSSVPLYKIENGFNFLKIARLVGDFVTTQKDSKEEKNYYENFKEAALKNASSKFFTNSLDLRDDEIDLFLLYCESDKKSKQFLGANNQFNLIDYLLTKKQEYNRITTFTK